MRLKPNLHKSSEIKESTRELLDSMLAGTADLSEISMEEYIQVAFVYAMSNNLIHIEQPVMYGGQHFNVHMCVSDIGPSPSLDDALGSTQ